MKVTALRYNNCNTLIYSRTRHDMRGCRCWKNDYDNIGIAIDGGFDYCKVHASPKSDYDFIAEYDLGEVDRKTLYQDWNTRTDNYGMITE